MSPTANAVRIKRTDGSWQDIAFVGATGPPGAPGPPARKAPAGTEST